MSSVLEELTKLENESILFNMDFAKKLASGETITSLDAVASVSMNNVEGSGDVTVGSTSTSDSVIQVRLSDGTSKEQYTVTITVTTSLANVRIGQGLLRIE